MVKLIKVIIFLSFTSLVMANSKPLSCRKFSNKSHIHGSEIFSLQEDMQDIHNFEDLKWWAVRTEDIQNSFCRKDMPADQEISQYISTISNKGHRANASVAGVNFKNESLELVNIFKDMVLKKNYKDEYLPEDKQRNIQKNHEINPECHKVRCAMEKVFGGDISEKMMYLKSKYGFNSSHLVFNNSDKIRENEIDNMIRGTQDFPKEILPVNKNKRMTKFKRGYTLSQYDSNDKVVANARMTFFDLWNDLDSEELKQSVVVHELAHELANEFELDDDQDWLDASGWRRLADDSGKPIVLSHVTVKKIRQRILLNQL